MNMIILGVLQIATIYSTTFSQFLAVRSIFGLFMGGVYGNAIAMVNTFPFPSTSPFLPSTFYLQLTNILLPRPSKTAP